LQIQIRAQRDTPHTGAARTAAGVRRVSQRPPWLTVALAGCLAAALDLTFAFIFYGYQGVAPGRLLRGIAAGVLGRSALSAGPGSAVLGAALHFAIAGCAAFIFYAASRRLSVLRRHWVLCGAGFGVAMYLAMHFVVIPLSRLPFRVPALHNVIGELFSHVFLFGIVIAWGAAHARAAAERAGGA
jgi:hypothetical protein